MIVQFSELGKFGRFGNQLFQYAFARSFAEKYNADLEIPQDWIGYKIFENILGNPIKSVAHRTSLDAIPDGTKNVNLFGYYQFEEALKFLSISSLRKWFKIKDSYLEMFPKTEEYYIAAHIRRGDYVSKYKNEFCLIQEESYTDCCKRYGMDAKFLRFVEEGKNNTDRKNLDQEIDFLSDFLFLMNSNVLLRSNSTFSYWAGILGSCKVYSPEIVGKVGWNRVNFVEGNWEPIVDQKFNKGTPSMLGSMYIQ